MRGVFALFSLLPKRGNQTNEEKSSGFEKKMEGERKVLSILVRSEIG
jgi:hypothetical protein